MSKNTSTTSVKRDIAVNDIDAFLQDCKRPTIPYSTESRAIALKAKVFEHPIVRPNGDDFSDTPYIELNFEFKETDETAKKKYAYKSTKKWTDKNGKLHKSRVAAFLDGLDVASNYQTLGMSTKELFGTPRKDAKTGQYIVFPNGDFPLEGGWMEDHWITVYVYRDILMEEDGVTPQEDEHGRIKYFDNVSFYARKPKDAEETKKNRI